MRVFLLLVLGVVSVSPALSQSLRVTGEAVRVLTPERGDYFMQPRWSPDGTALALTGASYKGLWIVSADGSDLRQVSDEDAVGFGMSWSSDSQALLARVARFDGPHRYNAVKLFDRATGTAQALTDERTRMPSLPQWNATDAAVYLPTPTGLETLATGKTPNAAKTDSPTFFAQAHTIARSMPATGDLEQVRTFVDEEPINLVISPDGRHLAFEILGGNLQVMRADGTGRLDLGRGHRPQWSPDGQWILYMLTLDDGHEYLASDLYAVRIDGSETVQLTDTVNRLEMNPHWSPDGRFIAFDETNEGAIYVLPVAYD